MWAPITVPSPQSLGWDPPHPAPGIGASRCAQPQAAGLAVLPTLVSREPLVTAPRLPRGWAPALVTADCPQKANVPRGPGSPTPHNGSPEDLEEPTAEDAQKTHLLLLRSPTHPNPCTKPTRIPHHRVPGSLLSSSRWGGRYNWQAWPEWMAAGLSGFTW